MPVVATAPEPVVLDAHDYDIPTWVSGSSDVRAYDRDLEREVFGPSHAIHNTTDLLLTNGLVRFWVGNRGMIPFLNVDGFASAMWHHSGVLALAADDSSNVLLNARLVEVTPDRSTVALDCRNTGPIFVTLQRGERMIRIQHGSDRDAVSGARYARWLSAPPTRQIATASATGKFNAGHRQADGDTSSEFLWPADVSPLGFTIAYWWLPSAASTTQATSGLASLWDDTETRVLHGRFDTADNKAKVTVGATTVASSALTFSANDPIFVAVRFSDTDGLALTVKTPTQTIEHVKAPGVVSVASSLLYLALRTTGAGTWGEGTWGEGTWGGLVSGKGTVDNIQIFDGYLSDDLTERLATAVSALDGISGIEGRLRWFAPFDVVPVTPALSGGRMVESSAGADGLKRMLASLASVGASDFGIANYAQSSDFAAALVSSETAASLHAQLASSFSQEVRVR